MSALTQETIQTAKEQGHKSVQALAKAHNIKASGKTDEILDRLEKHIAAGPTIPSFLKREAKFEPDPQTPVQPDEENETDPLSVEAYETSIAGEAVSAYRINLGDERYAGPFDTEADAVAFRDRHFSSKTKTGRKRHIAKTPNDPGKMGDAYRRKLVTYVQEPGDGDKLPAQAEGCLEAIRARLLEDHSEYMGQSVSQGELVDMLIEDAADKREFINTTQSPRRIWDFYRKTLVENGFISIV